MSLRKRRQLAGVLLVAAGWLVVAMVADHTGAHPPRSTGHSRVPRGVQPQAGHAAQLLAGLAVAPRPRGTQGYDRDAFGSAWADTDHNGCNQRDDVLLRDAVPGSARVARRGTCDHDVLAGSWHDPYTGRTLDLSDLKNLSQAEAVQIDHVVPLAEAWVSGASRWPAGRREAFANDLSELLAVDGPTNLSKGDDDPAAWRPRTSYQCAYAERWVAVKARYGLAVDGPEKAALMMLLVGCR